MVNIPLQFVLERVADLVSALFIFFQQKVSINSLFDCEWKQAQVAFQISVYLYYFTPPKVMGQYVDHVMSVP